MVEKLYVTYNDIHRLCQEAAPKILETLQPHLIIAIGGGGYVPARILRSFLKRSGGPNIPIQAIGLSLYESLPTKNSNDPASSAASTASSSGDADDGAVEVPGTKVTRTQWLDMSALGEMENLVGKRVLIVDEVDDTRTTLDYAVRELQKDVEAARLRIGSTEATKFSIFVLHNKNKPKKGKLPDDMASDGRYLAARTVENVWICYPWEAIDIDEHDRLAAAAAAKKT